MNVAQPFSSRAEALGALAAHTLEPTSIATPEAAAAGLTGPSNTVHGPAGGRRGGPGPHGRATPRAHGRRCHRTVWPGGAEPRHLPPTPCPCSWGHRDTAQEVPREPRPPTGQAAKAPVTLVSCPTWTLRPQHLPSEPLSVRGPSFWVAAAEAPARAARMSAASPSWPPRAGPFSVAWGPPNLGTRTVRAGVSQRPGVSRSSGKPGVDRWAAHLALAVTRAAQCVSLSSQMSSSSSSKGWMWSPQQASNRAALGCGRAPARPTPRPPAAPAPVRPRRQAGGLTLSSSASMLKFISVILSNGALKDSRCSAPRRWGCPGWSLGGCHLTRDTVSCDVPRGGRAGGPGEGGDLGGLHPRAGRGPVAKSRTQQQQPRWGRLGCWWPPHRLPASAGGATQGPPHPGALSGLHDDDPSSLRTARGLV